MSRRLIRFFKQFILEGAIEVTTAAGRQYMIGDGVGTPPAIRFTDRTAEYRLLWNPALVLGELFMEGRVIVTRGSIYDVLGLATRNLALQPPTRFLKIFSSLRKALRLLFQRNFEGRAKRNVAHHYDLDGRLYDLFLDPDRQYSCAYFEHPDQTLDDAQHAKKRHIAAKLLIEPGHNVLDIGSGDRKSVV